MRGRQDNDTRYERIHPLILKQGQAKRGALRGDQRSEVSATADLGDPIRCGVGTSGSTKDTHLDRERSASLSPYFVSIL